MRPDVAQDFNYGRRYLGHMKQIVGMHLIREAPAEEDMQHNTDLIVLRLDAIRIACRVRRPKNLSKYGHQFTIRTKRPNGTKTELAKVLEGWGDYNLYGFGAESGDYLTTWVLGDLDIFRLWFQRETVKLPAGRQPGVEQTNPDGTKFRAFNVAAMPPGFVVASHPAIQTRAAA
jgi:hypothetical protein